MQAMEIILLFNSTALKLKPPQRRLHFRANVPAKPEFPNGKNYIPLACIIHMF